MIRRMRVAAATAVLTSTVALGGCALLESSAPPPTPTTVESCFMDTTWRLDNEALAAQIVAWYADLDFTATEVRVEGTQDLTWQFSGDIVIETDYAIIVTYPSDQPENPWVVTQSISGVSTGRVFFYDLVAVPRDWDDSDVTIETTAVRGEEVAETIDLRFPKTIIDDVVGLEVTCTPELMTTHGRGTKMTQTWTPAP